MNITGIGQFNCSGETGYKALSFRIKWIHQNEALPSSNATLRLFSNNQNSYFELNLIDLINSSDTWANVTVEVGQDNLNWTSPTSPETYHNSIWMRHQIVLFTLVSSSATTLDKQGNTASSTYTQGEKDEVWIRLMST